MRRPDDLVQNLKEARAEASAIYLARVLTVDDRNIRGSAQVEVLERFKGKLKIGSTLTVPAGGGGDCTFPFKAQKTYVMYARGTPTDVSLCSRTREVASLESDTELTWLRTGALPPVPTVLLRETVRCTPCNLEIVTVPLVGLPQGDACNLPLRGQDVVLAYNAPGPFWAAGYYDPQTQDRRRAVGRSMDGRAFEVIQTPYHGTRDACRQRVARRWCDGLEPANNPRRGEPPLQCVHFGADEDLCDEEQSRFAEWGPPEEISAATCEWSDPAAPVCELSKAPRPLKAQPKSLEGPVLRCRPIFDRWSVNACEVVGGVHRGR